MTATDAERIAIADSYLQALLSRDGASVPFHPKAVRKEAGLKTGFSGAHLTRSLTSGPQYKLVKGISEKNFSVDGDNVLVDFLLDSRGVPKPLHVYETFHIPADDPRIRRIDVKFRRPR
ncbi:hypothetical protein J2X11_001195 [Aeromicrobium panaciterrae]|uniref:DUF8021 domain-containing protein n=1 Tax=Aeromicrobium panaciterrae TaxID=363861 RepID=A0ABU1UMF3_9ACTN|nr:hypothetical protein [Aeromicrobium panaciterrae]MDR7086356.1 hypothetical protein [Aeromicrobium panaciterrae]